MSPCSAPRPGPRPGGRVTAAFGQLAPATRARHLAALRSALAWWAEAGWVTADPTAGWARPKVPVDTTRALTRAQVAAIWKLDVPLRDKALWRMLYETAARAEEILGLDVPDLDLPSKRGRVISKGGTTDWVHWQTGTALLLPRLLAGRREGPVFLTSHKPGHTVASGDLCPVTRRARLSYRRAAESFERATRPLANPGARHEELEEVHGWTLHQLRHSLRTHEEMSGVAAAASFGGSGERALPAVQRAALEQARSPGSPCTLRDLGCHHPLASSRTMMQSVRLQRMPA